MKDFLTQKLADATKDAPVETNVQEPAGDDLDELLNGIEEDDDSSLSDADGIEADPSLEGESTEEDADTDDAEGEEESSVQDDVAVEPPVETETKEDPRVADLIRQNELLLTALAGRKEVEETPAHVQTEDDLPEDLLTAVMYGDPNNPALAQSFSPALLERAKEVARREARDRVRYAKDQNLFIREKVLPALVPQIHALMEPLVRAHQEQQVRGMQERHLTSIEDPKVRARAVELFGQSPGARGSWQERDAALGLAVKAALGEQALSAAINGKQKAQAGQAQAQAAGGKRLKGGPKGGNAKGGQNVRIPDMLPNETGAAFYRRIKHLLPKD